MSAEATPLIPPMVEATLLSPPEPPSEPTPGYRGPHTQTATGRHWYAYDPRPDDVSIADIAASLQRICRFGGHLREDVELYVDAEHAVRVCWLVRDLGGSALECFAALHHDSHEAYPPADQLGPFLRAMSDARACALLGLTPAAFDGVAKVIQRAKWAVREHLGISAVFATGPSASRIKHADMVLLATERRDLMAESDVDWGDLPPPLARKIRPWAPARAWALFMGTHEELLRAMGRTA